MSRRLLLSSFLCVGCAGQTAPGGGPQPSAAASPAVAPAATGAAAGPSTGETGAAPSPSGRRAGAPQPRWTMIDGVSDCAGQILSMYVCTPAARPAKCTEKAWKELTSLSGNDALTPCVLEPDLVACSVPIPDTDGQRCFPDQRDTKACPDDRWEKVKGVREVNHCKDVPARGPTNPGR